eukprot:3456934-Pleurochrysis_carterae.AAC.4
MAARVVQRRRKCKAQGTANGGLDLSDERRALDERKGIYEEQSQGRQAFQRGQQAGGARRSSSATSESLARDSKKRVIGRKEAAASVQFEADSRCPVKGAVHWPNRASAACCSVRACGACGACSACGACEAARRRWSLSLSPVSAAASTSPLAAHATLKIEPGRETDCAPKHGQSRADGACGSALAIHSTWSRGVKAPWKVPLILLHAESKIMKE